MFNLIDIFIAYFIFFFEEISSGLLASASRISTIASRDDEYWNYWIYSDTKGVF